jgi:GT2 family glycosyltransferase
MRLPTKKVHDEYSPRSFSISLYGRWPIGTGTPQARPFLWWVRSDCYGFLGFVRGVCARNISQGDIVTFAAVAIGRNEGERLKRCLESLSGAVAVIYVDSGSTDGSAHCARESGVEMIELDVSLPFTAARARNAGFRRLRKMALDIQYIQFVDGDCELIPGWPERATLFLDSHADVAAVCGSRRERFPERSIYNWLCEQDWRGPTGEVRACGGDVMIRANALEAVGGYRDDLIAGEDPELCFRLRVAGWRIWRLDVGMTLHDADMTRFDQWWRRVLRSGYVFAQGSYLHGASPERYYVWESRRALLWGIWLPLACLAAGLILGPWGWTIWLIYPLQVLRQTVRNRGSLSNRARLALFQLLGRFPESFGQIKFVCDRLRGRQPLLIEYK